MSNKSSSSDGASNIDTSGERAAKVGELLGMREFWSGQILHAGVKLGVFELLSDAPLAADAVADELGLEPAYCYRLLRALASLEVLETHDDRRFALSAVGELLQADHPDSLRDDVLFWRSPEYLRSALHLPAIISEGGTSGFAREFGCTIFEYAEQNRAFGAVFNGSQATPSQWMTPLVLGAFDAYEFGRVSHLCDVGGGHGHTLCHLLAEHAHLEGTVVHLPNVIDTEPDHWAGRLGVTDWCQYVVGDMFQTVPRADAYLLKFILHDWPDSECIEVLSTVREAAPKHCRVFVIERLVPEDGRSLAVTRADIEMMAVNDARERTEAAYQSLAEQAGWEFVQTRTQQDETLSVIELRMADA
ncbi:MAG: O-methyltransferase, partial [halophilic archaeon J07HX5]